ESMKGNSTLRSDSRQIKLDNYLPGANDELATVNDELSTGNGQNPAGPATLVNDDLALCNGTTIIFRTRPNENDPDRALGSFISLLTEALQLSQSLGCRRAKVSLCQIILQPIFNAVELFKNSK